MKVFRSYTDIDDVLDHVVNEHDDMIDAPMHLPNSTFGDSGHIHSDSSNRCWYPGCTGVYDPRLDGHVSPGTPVEEGGAYTGWTFAEDEDDDIPAHDHSTRELSEGGA